MCCGAHSFLILSKAESDSLPALFHEKIKKDEQHYKPSSVLDGYLSGPNVATRLKRPTIKHDGQPYRLEFGLASSGVYMCLCCYQQSGELLPRLSTLTEETSAVYFCCTGLGVTSTGRYPAPCPMKLGLSSPKVFRHE